MSSRSGCHVFDVLRPTDVVGAVLSLAAPDFCTVCEDILLFPPVTWLEAFGASRKKNRRRNKPVLPQGKSNFPDNPLQRLEGQ